MYRIAVFCKDVRFYRIPIRQLYDLRCAAFKVKPQLAPFAVVVYQIFVDSGGNRFTCFPTLRLPQRNCVCGFDLRCFCRARRKGWFFEIPISNGTTIKSCREYLLGMTKFYFTFVPTPTIDIEPFFREKCLIQNYIGSEG